MSPSQRLRELWQSRARIGRCQYCGAKAIVVEVCSRCSWIGALCAWHNNTNIDGVPSIRRVMSAHQNFHSPKVKKRRILSAKRKVQQAADTLQATLHETR